MAGRPEGHHGPAPTRDDHEPGRCQTSSLSRRVRCPDRIPPTAAEFPHGAHPIRDETGTKPSQGTAGRQSARCRLAEPSPSSSQLRSVRLAEICSDAEVSDALDMSAATPNLRINEMAATGTRRHSELRHAVAVPAAELDAARRKQRALAISRMRAVLPVGRPCNFDHLQRTQSRRGRPLQTLRLPSGGQRVRTQTHQDDRPARPLKPPRPHPGVDLPDVPPSQRHRHSASPRPPLSATTQQQNQVDGRQCLAIAGSLSDRSDGRTRAPARPPLIRNDRSTNSVGPQSFDTVEPR